MLFIKIKLILGEVSRTTWDAYYIVTLMMVVTLMLGAFLGIVLHFVDQSRKKEVRK